MGGRDGERIDEAGDGGADVRLHGSLSPLTWGDWLGELDEESRGAALVARDHLAALGSWEPEREAYRDATFSHANLAEWHFAREVWQIVEDASSESEIRASSSGKALLAAGTDLEQLRGLAADVADAVMSILLYRVDVGSDLDLEGTVPGWSLVATDLEGNPTDLTMQVRERYVMRPLPR